MGPVQAAVPVGFEQGDAQGLGVERQTAWPWSIYLTDIQYAPLDTRVDNQELGHVTGVLHSRCDFPATRSGGPTCVPPGQEAYIDRIGWTSTPWAEGANCVFVTRK